MRGIDSAYLPGNGESINNHSKSRRPKCGLEGKTNLSAFGKRRKDLISPSSALNRESDEETFQLAVIGREQVNAG